MAASTTTTDFSLATLSPVVQTFPARVNRRRSISPRAGHALVILGHAIEYLTDEYIHEGGSFCADNSQLQAVQLLMAVNRQIYFECPEVPSLKKRIASIFGLHAN